MLKLVIPTLMLPGLLLGAVPPTARHRWRFLAAMGLLLSLAWGLLVVGDAQVTTEVDQHPVTLFAGAAALGAANLLVALLLGLLLAGLGRRILRLTG